MILIARTRLSLCCLLLFGLLSAALCPAQEPIRVESHQVLVPTVVLDQTLYSQLSNTHHRDAYDNIAAKNTKLWDQITVKNLTARDFHLFEDGQEQIIQSVRFDPPAFRVVQDNLGKHPETVGTGGGIWGYPDHPAGEQSMWLPMPKYVIAYVPPPSAPDSCHAIQVKVNKKNLTVWTRSEYCNTPHPAADPLSGTELGKKLEAGIQETGQHAIDMHLNVAAFPEDAGPARVYLSMEFPAESLAHTVRNGKLYATFGALILVSRKDGTLAARYSDFACCDYGKEKDSPGDTKPSAAGDAEGQSLIPNRYYTQFALPPGDYEVQAAISDGLHFGVQTVSLTVTNDPGKLAISDVVLVRRLRKLPPASSAAEDQVSSSYSPLLSKGVEYTPTANPRFWPDETFFVYFEILEPSQNHSARKVEASFRIVATRSGATVDAFAPLDVSGYVRANSPIVGVGRGVILKHLAPGEYRFDVRATQGPEASTGWRSTGFTVMEVPPLQSVVPLPANATTPP